MQSEGDRMSWWKGGQGVSVCCAGLDIIWVCAGEALEDGIWSLKANFYSFIGDGRNDERLMMDFPLKRRMQEICQWMPFDWFPWRGYMHIAHLSQLVIDAEDLDFWFMPVQKRSYFRFWDLCWTNILILTRLLWSRIQVSLCHFDRSSRLLTERETIREWLRCFAAITQYLFSSTVNVKHT